MIKLKIRAGSAVGLKPGTKGIGILRIKGRAGFCRESAVELDNRKTKGT
jgi:hypothetical protein